MRHVTALGAAGTYQLIERGNCETMDGPRVTRSGS